MRWRSSNAITPAIVPAAEIAVRNPTATQNNGSVPHHPVIKSVPMTAVAHPDRMLTMAVTMAGFGSAVRVRDIPTATGFARGTVALTLGGWADDVGGSGAAGGISPVGCRRMMSPELGWDPSVRRVRASVVGSEEAGSGWGEAFSGARRMSRVLSSDERSRKECVSDEEVGSGGG